MKNNNSKRSEHRRARKAVKARKAAKAQHREEVRAQTMKALKAAPREGREAALWRFAQELDGRGTRGRVSRRLLRAAARKLGLLPRRKG